MKQTTAVTATGSRDAWKPIDRQEWKRRLHEARDMALARIAAYGLNDDLSDPDTPQPAALILELPLGAALSPALVAAQVTVAASIRSLQNPRVLNSAGEQEALSDQVFDYALCVAEAAYLYGLIAGTAITWPVIEAIQPPNAPPDGKRGRK